MDIHTHRFRHYFATNLLEKGANIKVVPELLGHSGFATMEIYRSVTADHLEGAIKLFGVNKYHDCQRPSGASSI